ncbi:predicted protein [Enterococcus faecalis Fly1]|nr:predicted protein [Enterococcus faecalis Fly1]
MPLKLTTISSSICTTHNSSLSKIDYFLTSLLFLLKINKKGVSVKAEAFSHEFFF